MGKLNISQQVRVASLSIATTAAAQSASLPLLVGDDEVGLLLASKFQVISYAAQVNDARAMLYRKTDNLPDLTVFADPDGVWQGDSSVMDVWACRFDTQRTAEGIDQTRWIYEVYPSPFIFIRQPSLIFVGSAANVFIALTLWYVLEEVTDAELAQLMVKDHA